MIRFLPRTAGVTPPARLPAGPPKVVQEVLADLKKKSNFPLKMIIPALSKEKTWFEGTFFFADLTILTSVTMHTSPRQDSTSKVVYCQFLFRNL